MADMPAWAKRGEAANKELARRKLEREEAQAKERAAAARAQREQMSVADKTRERGGKDMAAGMKLLERADARRSVKVANKTHDATKAYTDTMGTGARRKGLFTGAPQQRLPTPSEQIEAAQAPEADPVEAAPLELETADAPAAPAVPAGAMGTGVPGQLPEQLPEQAAPLEGEAPLDETPEQELARLEAEAMAQTPEQLEALAAEDYEAGLEQMPEQQPEEGVLQRQMDAAEELAQAKLNTEQDKADALTSASLQAQQALDDAAAAKEESDAKLEQQLEASKIASKTVGDLTEKARAMGSVDPRRAWTNMGIGRKIGFVLSIAAGALGHAMAGRDPEMAMAPLRRYVAEDIEAQENELGKLGQDIDAARRVAGDEANLLAQTRAVTDDKESARAMVEAARFRQIKMDLEAQIAQSGVGQASAEQSALLAKLEEEIAAKQSIIDAKAATNPEFFTKSVPVYGRGARKAMALAGEGLIKSGLGAQESAEEQEGKLEAMGAQAGMKRLEAQAKKGDKAASEAMSYAKEIAPTQEVVGIIDRIAKRGDIEGYGFTAGPSLSAASKDIDAEIDMLAEAYGRFRSGGVIDDDERAAFRAQILEGTTIGGEARLRRNLDRIRASMKLREDALERALSPEARSHYNRNVAAADFGARWTGDTGRQVVREDP